LVHGERSFSVRYIISQLEKEAFLAGCYKAIGMGAGPCRLCEECAIPNPCRRSTEARPSMEACGIDVFQTVLDSGFDIHVLKNPKEVGNYFGLLLLE
jgi:predicted metal-binding protein